MKCRSVLKDDDGTVVNTQVGSAVKNEMVMEIYVTLERDCGVTLPLLF